MTYDNEEDSELPEALPRVERFYLNREKVQWNNGGLFHETRNWPILDPRRFNMSQALTTIIPWSIMIIIIVAGLRKRDDWC
jgi:hypothetical protein